MGRAGITGEAAASDYAFVWWLTYEFKRKERNYAYGRKLLMISKGS
jgi:hypothetical protein